MVDRSDMGRLLLIGALIVVAGCKNDSAVVTATSVASTTTSAATATTSTTPSSTSIPGVIIAVQGDEQHVVGQNAMPTKCAVRYASNGQALPDPNCTPGVIATRVTQANIRTTICTPAYTSSIRPPTSVTDPLKHAAVRAYGLKDDARIEYDHLIPLELGGANDVRNLWPEPPTSPTQKTTANAKDDVENALHDLVCKGRLTLAEAQQRIATDWTTAAH